MRPVPWPVHSATQTRSWVVMVQGTVLDTVLPAQSTLIAATTLALSQSFAIPTLIRSMLSRPSSIGHAWT